jgi:hypothetical protein
VTRSVRARLLAAALPLLASPLVAQLGEVQFGALASYGRGDAFGAGAGLVLGVAPGRLAYVGLRWTYQAGTTKAGVTNRVQVFATDLGVEIPAGALEVVPGLSLGALRFAQRAAGVSRHATEFLAAPGAAVELHLARVALIPELQYVLAGDPELPSPVGHRGAVASLRLVIPLEVGRIRR